MNNKPKVIALIGLDGVGKTTLFKMLSEELVDNDYYFVGRGAKDSELMVEKYYPKKYGNYKDWITGDFHQVMSMACAFDYVTYYERTIRPFLEGVMEGIINKTPKVIITDRHAICFMAYAYTSNTPCYQAIELLKSIPSPDALLKIICSEENIEKRNTTKDEFENPVSQNALENGYKLALKEIDKEYYTVDNNNSLYSSLEDIKRIIINLLNRNH